MKALPFLPCLLLAAQCATAQATLLVYDPFNTSGPNSYTADVSYSNAVNNNQPAAAGAWTSAVNGFTTYIVSGNGLSYDNLATSGGSLASTPVGANTRAFSSTNVTDTLYYSFLIRFSSFENNVIIGLGDASGGIASGLWVGADGATLGRATNAYSANGAPLSLDTTYLVVGKYSHHGATSLTTLWINPTVGDPEPESAFLTAVGTAGVGAAQWYSYLGGSPAPSYVFDEFRVGTTWESVTPQGIPEPGTYALLTSLLLAACGLKGIRHKFSRQS